MRRHTILFGFLLLLATFSLFGCDHPAPALSTAEPGTPLLSFERKGGIAGFQDRLVIGYGGEYYLSRIGQVEKIGSLSAERSAQLQAWLAHFAPFTLRFEDNPGGPDNLVRQLVWKGLGKVMPNQAQQQEMLSWVSDLLAELSVTGD